MLQTKNINNTDSKTFKTNSRSFVSDFNEKIMYFRFVLIKNRPNCLLKLN